ncbi:MAG: DoxX family protein [Caldilineaceae bacterium]
MFYDLAILIIRVVIGLTVAAHGAQKLFGAFGGPGLAGVTGWLASMRLRPARVWALVAGLSEFGGGLLMALGLLGPLGPLGVIATMAVAITAVHWGRFFNSSQGIEFPLTLLAGALAILVGGVGAYSLDALLGLTLPEPLTSLGGLVLVIIGVVLTFVTRAPATA